MHRFIRLFFIFVALFFFSSCGGEHVSQPGSHFQNRDCLLCHNRDLASSAHLSFGGTTYLDAGSDPDDLSKMCKDKVFMQLINSGTVYFDERNLYDVNDAGALGRGNMYLLASKGSITAPSGSYLVRLILADGTQLAESSFNHNFNKAYDPAVSADVNNQYSCNACHSIGADGLMTVQENLSFCLSSINDVPFTRFFAADTYPILQNRCTPCHNGGTFTPFDMTTDIEATRQVLVTAEINKTSPSNSALFNCPIDSNHTSLDICMKTGGEYNRIIDWIQLEAQQP